MRHVISIVLILNLAPTLHAQVSVPPSWLELAGSGTGYGISGVPSSGHPAMVLNSDGEPVVSWVQGTPSGAWIYVRRWNGSAWVEFGGSGSGSGIWPGVETSTASANPCIALDGSGNPTVVYRDSGVGNYEIHLVRWTGGAWQELGGSATGGGISGFAGVSREPSVAVTSSGNPCVAWVENEGIHVRRWTGSAWESLSGLAAPYVASGATTSPALALDSAGQPVLAWSHLVTAAQPGAYPTSEIRVKRWDGSGWVSFDGTEDGDALSPVFTGTPTSADLILDGSGYPVVVWHANPLSEIYLRRWNGSSWIELGGSGSGNGISNTYGDSQYPSVAFGPGGNPVVSWSEASLGGEETFVRRWNGSAWAEMDGSASGGGVSASDDEGSTQSDVAVAPGGTVYVSWNEGGQAYLRYWPVTGIADLAQFHPDGATAIPVGGYANLASVVFRGAPVSIAPSGQLRMQIEVQPLGMPFTGTPTAESGLVDSESTVDVLVENVAGGEWHWAARTMSEGGTATEWVSYGGNTEGDADFTVTVAVIIKKTAPPGDGGGGGGGGVGCGLLGLEAMGLLLMLRAGWRRFRTKNNS